MVYSSCTLHFSYVTRRKNKKWSVNNAKFTYFPSEMDFDKWIERIIEAGKKKGNYVMLLSRSNFKVTFFGVHGCFLC